MLDAKCLWGVAVMISALLLTASFVHFEGTPAKASTIVTVDVSEILPTLFYPQGVTINVGDTVFWTSLVASHTTTSDPGQAEFWNSGDFLDGETFSWTFTHAGNFTYHSSFPEDAGQIGWVFVQAPTPEFPGDLAFATIVIALVLALLVERKIRR
jgi:plastocyanin